MITIPIQVTGDAWNNCQQVEELLPTLAPKTEIMLDLCSEGPSLHALGVVKMFQQYDFDITVTRWSNGVESVPFKRYLCNSQSHFYPYGRNYWRPQWPDKIENTVPSKFRFGLFLGRSTLSRNRILYDAATKWGHAFLLSKMSDKFNLDRWATNSCSIESADDWINDVKHIQNWLQNCSVGSIDNHIIQDQFKVPEISSAKMAMSLLEFYKTFNIELVCESYTLGETFFPTEKTVRPMVGNRPFIVFGPRGFLKNLREQEGFKTFAHIWDESYDQLEGRPRWDAISKLIDNLLLFNNADWKAIIDEASKITNHNQIVLRKIIHDRQKL